VIYYLFVFNVSVDINIIHFAIEYSRFDFVLNWFTFNGNAYKPTHNIKRCASFPFSIRAVNNFFR